MAKVKKEVPSYDNKAVSFITEVEVIREHDGINVGYRLRANKKDAEMMIEKGYWKYVKED